MIPTSHRAVEHEWRISHWERNDPSHLRSARFLLDVLPDVGDKILEALGTPLDTEWEWSGEFVARIRSVENLEGYSCLVGKKGNVVLIWGVGENGMAARILVFDPDMIPLYMHQPDD